MGYRIIMFTQAAQSNAASITITALGVYFMVKVLGAVQVCIGMANILLHLSSGCVMLLGATVLIILIFYQNWGLFGAYLVSAVLDLILAGILLEQLFAKQGLEGNEMALAIISLIKFPFYFLVVALLAVVYQTSERLDPEEVLAHQRFENYGSADVIEPFTGRSCKLRQWQQRFQ